MKIAVCDDSRSDRGALKALLNTCGQDFEIREYGSSVELCEDMGYVWECGIVFLDINMNGADGLETASRFLFKDDLEQPLSECVDDILREIRQEEQVVEFGFVEGNKRLRVGDIIYIETNRHKNVFYTMGQTYSIYKKMDELEKELAGMGFVRIHQRFLINMRYIEKISSYVMVLTTGKEISVPKARYPEVKRQYTLFKGGGRSDDGMENVGAFADSHHGGVGKCLLF